MIKRIGLTLVILLALAANLTACTAKDYSGIKLHMTYSEVVKLLGEPDGIFETHPDKPMNSKYYEWRFDDGNILRILLHYPGEYPTEDIENSDKKKPKRPDDYVVYSYYVMNESLLPTTEPSTEPTE